MQLPQLLQRSKVAVERTGVRVSADAGKPRRLIVGPGVRNCVPCRSSIAERVAKMREFVGNSIRLQIGDVVAGKINAPLLEISANDFRAMMFLMVFFRCDERRCKHERKQHARQHAGKHNSEHPATKSNRHKRHLDTKDSKARPTIDLYSSVRNIIIYREMAVSRACSSI